MIYHILNINIIHMFDYQIISVNSSVTRVQTCERRRDGMMRERYSRIAAEPYILAAIAYNLHQLDDGHCIPADFATKVTRLPKNALSIGEWHFVDPCRLPKRLACFPVVPTCCIGFEMIYDDPKYTTFIGFVLDDPSLCDVMDDDLENNPHKALFFTQLVTKFYQLVNVSSRVIISDITKDMYRTDPSTYKSTIYDFTNFDDYIAAYPFMINPDSSCKYKYPIIDLFFAKIETCDEIMPPAGAVSIFTHMVTKWGMEFDTATHESLMSLAATSDDKYLAILHAQKAARALETPEERAIRRNHSFGYDSSSDDD